MSSYLIVHLVVFLFLAKTSAQQCSSRTNSIYGKALVNHTYHAMYPGSLSECLLTCMNDVSGRCRSMNWDMTVSRCELNDKILEEFSKDLIDKPSSIYMTTLGHVIPQANAPLGNENSCKEILQLGRSIGNGIYWIDPEKTGSPIQVYCDMTTAGGGWILIKNRTITLPLQTVSTFVKSKDYRDISKYNQLDLFLANEAFTNLRKHLGVKQFRWFCRKRNPGRTFHIMLNELDKGLQAFNFLTSNSLINGQACGSFETLPDDNSVLSQNCNSWGKDGDKLRIGRWGWSVESVKNMRAYRSTARMENNCAFAMFYNQFGCDDIESGTQSLSNGDTWLLYVR